LVMALSALHRRLQAQIGPTSALSLADVERDLALITRRGRTWVQYQRDVWRLPLARQLYLQGLTAERRRAGLQLLVRLAVAEIDDMLRRRHVHGPKAINRYGRMLLCGIISLEDQIRRMKANIPLEEWSMQPHYPLNEFHEFHTGIRQELQEIWTWAELGERIVRAMSGAPSRPGNEDYEMRQQVLHGIAMSRVPIEDRKLLMLVWTLDPRGAEISRIAEEVWQEVSQAMARYDPPIRLTPDACRMRYSRIRKRLRRDLAEVPDMVDAIMTLSRPE
jgi:hypothetical protein